jgi:hypothetical protein
MRTLVHTTRSSTPCLAHPLPAFPPMFQARDSNRHISQIPLNSAGTHSAFHSLPLERSPSLRRTALTVHNQAGQTDRPVRGTPTLQRYHLIVYGRKS